jgi:hypothetical protein
VKAVGFTGYRRGVREFHVYEPLAAPLVEVEKDGAWWPGHARMRTSEGGQVIYYQVQFRRDGDNFLDVFPPDRVRLDQIDRSRGRGTG